MLGNAGKRGRMLPAKWKGKWWMSHFKVGTRWSSPEIWRCDRNIRNIVTKCREKLVENNQQTLCVRKKLDTANRNIPVLRKFWDLAPQQSGLKNSPWSMDWLWYPQPRRLGSPMKRSPNRLKPSLPKIPVVSSKSCLSSFQISWSRLFTFSAPAMLQERLAMGSSNREP